MPRSEIKPFSLSFLVSYHWAGHDLLDCDFAVTAEKPHAAPTVHHYIPMFYSKRWASGDPATLTRYALWRPGLVAVDRKVPKDVGWERNGYSSDCFEGAPAELMKPKDDKASKMLARLEEGGADGHWSDEDRFGWTWFLVSLLVRGPEDVWSAKRNIAVEWASPSRRMEARYQALFKEFPEMRGQAHSTLKEYIVSKGEEYGKRLYEPGGGCWKQKSITTGSSGHWPNSQPQLRSASKFLWM
jgi:hypothetical protein